MSNLEIIPIEYANSVFGENNIFQNGDAKKLRPIVFMIFLIKTENHLILVDAGCEAMPDFDMHDFIGPIKALEKLGISPEDITDVIITHAHHDHIACVSYFKNAAIYIQREEYNNGKNYFAKNMDIRLFDEEAKVFDNVKAVKIGGHSIGSSIVEVNDGNKIFVIAGDECYSKENLEKHIPAGAPYSPEKNREFIDKYSSDKYTVLLCHDK